MLKLYQFPISHFCEKARWALDFKGLDYQFHNLLPGLHSITTRKLAAKTSVPILADGNDVIQGSNKIITYLDEKHRELVLTPEKPELKAEALEWEEYLDAEIGIHLRRCIYHILLEHPEIVIPFFLHNGPWYGKFYCNLVYPKLQQKMRQGMNINDKTFEQSKVHLRKAVDRLYQHKQEHQFIVGKQFSRADLTAAALLAPLCSPKQYGLNWPASYPEPLATLIQEFTPKTAWVGQVYDKYRR